MAINFRPNFNFDPKAAPRTEAKPDLASKPKIGAKPEIPPSLENAAPVEVMPEPQAPPAPARPAEPRQETPEPISSRVPQEGWDAQASTMQATQPKAQAEKPAAEPRPPVSEPLKDLAEMTAPTQIGTPEVGVEPGLIVDQESGVIVERPDEDAVVEAPLSETAKNEQLAYDRAKAKKQGAEPTRQEINAEVVKISQEIKARRKFEEAKKQAPKAKAEAKAAAQRRAEKLAQPTTPAIDFERPPAGTQIEQAEEAEAEATPAEKAVPVFTRPPAGTQIEEAESEEGVVEPPLAQTPEQAEAIVDEIIVTPHLSPEEEAAVASEVAPEVIGVVEEEPPVPPEEPPIGGGKGGGPKEPRRPRQPKAESPAYSEAFQRIVQARREIKAMLRRGVFQLDGDSQLPARPALKRDKTVKTVNGKVVMMEPEWEHSPAVKQRIKEMLHDLGQQNRKSNEKMLFVAFQVYRGFSLDRDAFIFNQDPGKVKISDEQFIAFLDEITANIRTYGHPFAFRSDKPVGLGGTRAYPLPVTPELAKFFTKVSHEKGNLIPLDEDAFIEFSMNEWIRKDGVLDTIDADVRNQVANYGQRESLMDFVDVIAELWAGDPRGEETIQPRSVNSRISGNEMFDIMSDYAKAVNEESELGLFLQEQVRHAERARAEVEKMNKKLPPHKKKERVTGKDVENTSWLKDFSKNPPSHKTVTAALMAASRTAQVAFMPALAGTAIGEHGIGIVDYTLGQKWLNSSLLKYEGVSAEATEGSLELVTTPVFMQGIENALGIQQSRGSYALEDAGYRNVDLTAELDTEGLEAIREWIMQWSSGDALFQKQVAKIFMRNLVYQFARSEVLARKEREKNPDSTTPILKVTAEQLEAMMRTNPRAFFRLVATTEQGRAALHYASSTSLNGTDYLTMGLRNATMNPYADMALSIIGGPFLKYATRSLLFRMPFSTSLMYINKVISDQAKIAAATGLEAVGKKVGGKIGELSEGAVEHAQESNRVGNEYLIGGNESLRDGLGQALIIDLARAPSKIAVIALVGAIVAMLGVEPPDDEEKDHLWYEYSIGGAEFKTAWYWTELLGGTMPLVVAASVAAKGDLDKAWQVLSHGLMAGLEEGAWLDVADTLDLVFSWDYHLAEAQARSEGYMGEFAVSEAEYGITMLGTFLGRRFYKAVEPAVFRAIYNEAGIDFGREKLAHSTNVVYTKDPDDTAEGKLPRTTSTSWSDSQVRKMAYSSWTMGFLLNLFGGYFINNQEEQKTGYWRAQMPYITNADPYQVEMMSDLVVLDENGEEMPYDKWTEAERRAIGNRVIDWVSAYQPSQLAANGVVLPYDARVSAKLLLDEQWTRIEDEYRDRIEAGEFSSSYNGLTYEQNAALKNDAWKAKDAAQQELSSLLDSIWSDDIPYAPTVYNRWETVYRPMYVWKDGTEHAGEPTTKMMWRMHKDDIELKLYPGGEHKSSFLPIHVTDDQGQNTYDAQTGLSWQTPDTDMDFVEAFARNNPIAKGMNEGEDLWGVIGAGMNRLGTWDNGRLVMGVRAYVPAEMPHKEIDSTLKYLGSEYTRPDAKAPTGNGGWSSWGGGGGGGGSYSPNIYSHPAYSLNSDKPAGLYTKVPSYARFDYLRPSVETKGSREAYRREDF